METYKLKETLVSFKVAELAKKKGFGLGENDYCQTLYYYNTKGSLNNIEDNIFKRNIKTTHLGAMTMDDVEVGISLMDNSLDEFALAPTQDLLRKWLLEIHSIHITIFSKSQESWMYRVTKKGQSLEEGLYGEDFHSHDEAREEALFQVLNLLPDAN